MAQDSAHALRPAGRAEQAYAFLLRHAGAVFSVKTFIAATLALLIGLWLDLPRPYWAMATVYITSQPLSAATLSKSAYRVGGTVLGALAALLLVPVFVGAPELLCLAIALWVGLCLYLSLLDRTPRAYLFMLAGYTAAIIGFPVVSVPELIFDTALARVEEISLGIICACLVSIIILPRPVGPAVALAVENWLKDARQLARDVLSGQELDQDMKDKRLRLAGDAIEIDTLADHLAYDFTASKAAVEALRTIRAHMLMLLPLTSSITDRMAALGPHWRDDYPDMARLVDQTAIWITQETLEREPADVIRAEIAAQLPHLDSSTAWREIIRTSLLMRLRDLVDVSQDCRTLTEHIATNDPTPVALRFLPDLGVAHVRYRDHGMALWSAAGAALAVLTCCAAWIATAWADGATAAMMAAVGCSIFAAQDDPVPRMRSFALWALVGMLVVAVYKFAIMPVVPSFPLLVVALAPPFLVFGWLIAQPATTGIGVSLGSNVATLLALQSTYDPDFVAFLNVALSFNVGMIVAVLVTLLTRSVGAEWSARRLMRIGWAALATAAERRGMRDRAQFAGLMLNRIGLLAPRLAAIPQNDLHSVDSLAELRVGLNIVDLRRARWGMDRETRQALDEMLDTFAREFRRRRGVALAPDLLERIDHALGKTLRLPEGRVRHDALIGLVGMRRGLFPQAPGYAPETGKAAS
ncbi:FUSC family protein [Methylovirgula sp. 4M-Z18]|uniref:FUSC family protein n=1 Tax=Methylovirgula sp. 4M-Z18 TaxID=2293567 RepID=UPI001FDEDC0E|nr:FUSC family protein [Methylovirgula sp. 4M-Z18]